MKKKSASRKSSVRKSAAKKSTSLAKAKSAGLGSLIAEVRQLIQSARRGVSSVIDTFQVMTNFEIGRRIVEHEQKGKKRAAYGAELLKELSARLTDEFGRGFSHKSLENMRKFYLLWKDRRHEISQTPSAKLLAIEKGQTLSDQSRPTEKPQTVSAVFAFEPISERPSWKSPFTLSWSHYVELLSIKDPDERSFYEIEAAREHWSLSELRRQKASSLYERLALSRDKDGIRKLAKEGQIIVKPEDLLKEPLVLEFLGLEVRERYTEPDLESAILNHLENFLLELGKGFLFEARQKRFTFDGDHYFLDLVFYNRLLRCYELSLERDVPSCNAGRIHTELCECCITQVGRDDSPRIDQAIVWLSIIRRPALSIRPFKEPS